MILKFDKFDNNRLLDNLKILSEVLKLVLKCPDLRFIQVLWALGIVDSEDRFYEEPCVTLARIKRERRKSFRISKHGSFS